MAFDDYLAERISRILKSKKIAFEERKMFGGLCYMIDDKMCLGIVKNDFMARVGPDAYEKALAMDGARPMDFTKRPMNGYVFVSPEGVNSEQDLERWIDWCLAYNPLAKSSKKSKGS